MCAFLGIPSTQQQPLSETCPAYGKQPGQNLLIYINKYRELHWWCVKKLPWEETYKLTPQPVLLLTSRLHRQKTLQKNCGTTRRVCKLVNLQKCFNEAAWAYKCIQGGQKHRRDLGDPWVYSGNQWDFLPTENQSMVNNRQRQLQNANKGNMQGFKNNNNFNANKAYNNGPQRSSANSCFGPREIYKIHQLLDENAKQPWMLHWGKVSKIHCRICQKLGNLCTYQQSRTWSLGRTHGPPHWVCNAHEINMFAFSDIEEANESCIWLVQPEIST